jgi:hypothetical protein
MIAHAGLASKSIEVMFNNEIWIKYRKECLEKTKEIMGNALKETRNMIKGESQT